MAGTKTNVLVFVPVCKAHVAQPQATKGGLKHRLRLIFLFTFCIKAKSKTLAVANCSKWRVGVSKCAGSAFSAEKALLLRAGKKETKTAGWPKKK